MAAALPRKGELFADRYRVEEKLAAGGMGAVFRATDTREDRTVAVKFLHPELADEVEMHRRFRREASILKAIDHPSVVRVHDVGRDDIGRSYTVMELLEGETLHACIRREGGLSIERLKPIVTSMCEGLAAVHDHGVLHGDLKPANVFLIDPPGEPAKLVDFGTSKVHGLERLTRTGEIIGTPIYMAPELLTGDGAIDERIDVYALGVLLYEALSGETPFTERNPGKLLFQVVMGEGVPLQERVPNLSPDAVAIVNQAMARAKADRFANPRAIARAFAQL